MCPEPSIQLVPNALPQTPRLHVVGAAPAGKVHGPSSQCILCEFVIDKVRNMLTENSTEVSLHTKNSISSI